MVGGVSFSGGEAEISGATGSVRGSFWEGRGNWSRSWLSGIK